YVQCKRSILDQAQPFLGHIVDLAVKLVPTLTAISNEKNERLRIRLGLSSDSMLIGSLPGAIDLHSCLLAILLDNKHPFPTGGSELGQPGLTTHPLDSPVDQLDRVADDRGTV